jgi:pimeloyl-ACP methyl ester carboxylesterase
VETPDVQYAEAADGVHIAYQVVGEGPADLLFVPGAWSNLTWNWQLPSYAHFLRRLSSFCRLIVVDRRGSGLSDRLSPDDLPALETLADDSEWSSMPPGPSGPRCSACGPVARRAPSSPRRGRTGSTD